MIVSISFTNGNARVVVDASARYQFLSHGRCAQLYFSVNHAADFERGQICSFAYSAVTIYGEWVDLYWYQELRPRPQEHFLISAFINGMYPPVECSPPLLSG